MRHSGGAFSSLLMCAPYGTDAGPPCIIAAMARLTTVGESAAMSRELSDFLIELSIGLHKNAIYPAGHPLLENTTAELGRRLAVLLKERPALSLGVARNQLIIEGVATDEANPVLRELAGRLHRHHLGAVKFSAGVTEDELTDMLSTVSVDAGRLPRPLGLESAEVLTQWPHVRLYPLTFAQLQLIEEDPDAAEQSDAMSAQGNRSAQLWAGLARAALVAEAAKIDTDDPGSVDPIERGVHAASKLVHVCDVYDALRTKRPYREAWESERVLEHMEKGAGPDFDIDAATAFCSMMRQWERREAVTEEMTPVAVSIDGALPAAAGAAS